jgi:hypothetical protein
VDVVELEVDERALVPFPEAVDDAEVRREGEGGVVDVNSWRWWWRSFYSIGLTRLGGGQCNTCFPGL